MAKEIKKSFLGVSVDDDEIKLPSRKGLTIRDGYRFGLGFFVAIVFGASIISAIAIGIAKFFRFFG